MTANPSGGEHLLAMRERNVPRGILTAHPVVVDRGAAGVVWDVTGKRYLDFVGGIGVLNVGHNHPKVVAAVRAQLESISHMAFQVAAYGVYISLAERLNRLIGGTEAYKTVFLTTGAEAVENAIKIARSHTGRPGVIAFRGGFHGRTLLGVTLTGFAQPYKQNFGPFPGEIYHADYPDEFRGVSVQAALDSVNTLLATEIAPDRVAAIIVEPVQGDGGFLPAPDAFMQGLRELADRHGIVLIMDEIQTGFGRTGKMFGFEHSGVRPDLVTVAKSLAGGFPLSGVVGRSDIMDAPTPGGLGGTYGGNAVACAAAHAVLDVFQQDDLCDRAERLGRELRRALLDMQAKHDGIGDVRGRGFMQAIEFVVSGGKEPDPDRAQRVVDRAREGGLLIIKCGVHRNVVRFLAPLVISDEELSEAIKILDLALVD
ncbi:4-aminobutyrate--2-oxoglutarate transaminase [Mesorhizobium sp. CAU 1732]|uniref:4-aminobutyrate--2-oxoglutarate transaminase n=1 Tax=Mesorhizobium sp. CAU 1732 TaxID=3140358 RepID=UPI00325FE497